MASQTKSAGLGQSIARGGDTHWINPTRIYISNNSYAAGVLTIGQETHWLRARTFGFTIPAGATINGIRAQIEKKAGDVDMMDESVKILRAGVVTGDEKKSGADWPLSDAYTTYGGSTDKWGKTWTVAQINATNFGVNIAATLTAGEFPVSAFVDHIKITVYYTPPPPTLNTKINISDSFKEVTNIYIRDGTPGLDWKPVVKVQINIGDAWKTIFG